LLFCKPIEEGFGFKKSRKKKQTVVNKCEIEKENKCKVDAEKEFDDAKNNCDTLEDKDEKDQCKADAEKQFDDAKKQCKLDAKDQCKTDPEN
jgi:hypothetical protein